MTGESRQPSTPTLAAHDVAPDRLQVLRAPDGYLLRYAAGPSRERILALFGTDTLPLPWTAAAPPERVVAAVRRSHPHAFIEELSR